MIFSWFDTLRPIFCCDSTCVTGDEYCVKNCDIWLLIGPFSGQNLKENKRCNKYYQTNMHIQLKIILPSSRVIKVGIMANARSSSSDSRSALIAWNSSCSIFFDRRLVWSTKTSLTTRHVRIEDVACKDNLKVNIYIF